MWLWRHSEHNNLLFFKVLCISVLAHLAIGLMLFAGYKGNVTSVHITFGGHSAKRPVLFANPKRRSLSQRRNTGIKKSSLPQRSGNRSKVEGAISQSAQSSVAEKPVACQKNLASDTIFVESKQPVSAKEQQKKSNAGPTIAIKKNQSKAPPEKIRKKEEQNKKSKITKPPKELCIIRRFIEPKKTDQVKRTPEKLITKESPVLPTPSVVQEARQLPANEAVDNKQEFKREALEPSTLQENVGEADDESEEAGSDEFDEGDEGDFITAEVARMQYAIEQELIAHWKPPKGLPKDLECQIKIRFTPEGKISNCELEKKSGVLIYDMAARTAAKAMMLPRWSWGKEFIIAFKQ